MMISLIFIGLIIVTDQVLKMQVVNNIKPIGEMLIIPGFLKISYVENKGAAFGVLQGYKYFFIIISIVMIAIFVYFMFIKKITNKLFLTSAVLILGGGIGNLIDRLLLGYVVDYIKISFFPPVCNLADYCISIGAILLFTYFFFLDKNENKLESTINE